MANVNDKNFDAIKAILMQNPVLKETLRKIVDAQPGLFPPAPAPAPKPAPAPAPELAVDVAKFTKQVEPHSYYHVHFEIDQRDADNISVATHEIEGKVDAKTLIKLAIMKEMRSLSDWDGAWYNIRPIEDYLGNLLCGTFYDACNRFTIDGVWVTGYDADTKQFYRIDIPRVRDLGIKDIDEAYEKYFPRDPDDDYDFDSNDD